MRIHTDQCRIKKMTDAAEKKKKLLSAIEADEVEKKLRVDAHVARYLEPMEKAFGIQADIVDTLVDGKSVWVVMQHRHHGQFTVVIHPSPEQGATLSDHGENSEIKVATPEEAEQVFAKWVGKSKTASDLATATARAETVIDDIICQCTEDKGALLDRVHEVGLACDDMARARRYLQDRLFLEEDWSTWEQLLGHNDFYEEKYPKITQYMPKRPLMEEEEEPTKVKKLKL